MAAQGCAGATRRPRSRPPATTIYSEAEADTILNAAAATGGADGSSLRVRAGLETAVIATLRWAGQRGVDLYALSRLLGHARVETTQRYLHLDTGQLADAIQRAYPRNGAPPRH